MIIAIDYDGTYDTYPDMWEQFISDNDHQIDFMIVTCRNPGNPIEEPLPDNVEVIYTDGQAKAPYLDNLGIIDDIIWIDNEPEYIIHRKRPAR